MTTLTSFGGKRENDPSGGDGGDGVVDNHKKHKKNSNSVANDALFFEQQHQHQTDIVSTAATLANASTKTNNNNNNQLRFELHRANLLQLQCQTLIESILHCPPKKKKKNSEHDKIILQSLEYVSKQLNTIGQNNDNKRNQNKLLQKNLQNKNWIQSCPFFYHYHHRQATTSSSSSENIAAVAKGLVSKIDTFATMNKNNNNHQNKMNSSSSSWLSVIPINPQQIYFHQDDITLPDSSTLLEHQLLSSDSTLDTKISINNIKANAHVIPTYNIIVQLNNILWDPKDITKNKYFIVSI